MPVDPETKGVDVLLLLLLLLHATMQAWLNLQNKSGACCWIQLSRMQAVDRLARLASYKL